MALILRPQSESSLPSAPSGAGLIFIGLDGLIKIKDSNNQLHQFAQLSDVYKSVSVNTYALALIEASGVQKKIITVLSDETDNNITNRYFYEGNNTPLGNPIF